MTQPSVNPLFLHPRRTYRDRSGQQTLVDAYATMQKQRAPAPAPAPAPRSSLRSLREVEIAMQEIRWPAGFEKHAARTYREKQEQLRSAARWDRAIGFALGVVAVGILSAWIFAR